MDFGVQLMTHGIMTRDRDGDAYIAKIPAAEMRPVETAVLAESLGYHSVWLSDHIVTERVTEGAPHVANVTGKRAYPDRPNMLDVPTTLGAIASRTTTLRLAPSVWIAPYRHPLVAAHMFATLDVLSGGRVIVAYGAGWERGEFEALGRRLEDRGPLTDETVEVMIKSSEHLKEVLLNISKVKGVYKAVRGRGRAGSDIESDGTVKEELH